MKEIHSLVFLLMFFFVSAVWAGPAPEISGLGNAKCADFIKGYDSGNLNAVAPYLAWAQGFMSAINLSRSKRDLSTKTFADKRYSADQQLAYLVSYCKEDRYRDFAGAVINLYIHLPRKH